MSAVTRRRVVAVGGGEPFARSTWSGASYWLMSALRNTGALTGAVAGWPEGLDKIERVATFSPNGRRWRQRYWAEASVFDGSRRRMTNAFASRRAAEIDPAPDVLLQLGAWYDPTRVVKPRLRCSYHDMHLALFLTQPGMLLDRTSRLVSKALERERRTFERIDVVFAMSDWLRDSIIRDCGQDPGKVVTVFTGANIAIPDVPVERDDGPPRFLFVGMRFERKGGQYLLDAFEHVKAARPDAELWIVGPEHPVREQKGVQWLGRIDRSTPKGDRHMKELYEQATAFVMPSVFEPTGNVFLEAMAHALPCVGTQTCAMPEFIADGVSGLLAEPGDVEDIARHMLSLAADPARSRAMGLEGFRRVREHFNWPTVARRMVGTMESRLGETVAVDSPEIRPPRPARGVTRPRRASGPLAPKRLGVYTDMAYRSDRDGVYSNRAFVRFVTRMPPRVAELVILGRLDPEPGAAAYRLPRAPVRFVPLPYYARISSVAKMLASVRGSCRVFAAELEHLDVVWIFGPQPMAVVFAWLARRRGVPLVLGVRQDYPRYIAGRLPGRRWRWALPIAHALDAAFRRLARHAPTVAVGEEIARRYATGAPVIATGLSLVERRDVVPLDVALSRSWSGNWTVLSVGRLDPEKNPLLLLDIAERLRDFDARWRLVIAGDGPLRPELERQIDQHRLTGFVELLGEVENGAELWDLYRRCQAFLHVSLTEGLPQVLFEAQAAGVPIVATDVGGVRSALLNGSTGLLIAPRDPEAAVTALRRLADSAELRRQLIAAALEHVADHTLEAQLDRISAFIAETAAA